MPLAQATRICFSRILVLGQKPQPSSTPWHYFLKPFSDTAKTYIMRHAALFFLLFSFFTACEKNKPVEVTQESYPIPGERFFPEGIAYDRYAGVFYTGSTVTGDVVRVNVKTGATELFAPGAKQNRSFCTGMKLDSKDRLWVCGGDEGKVHLINKHGESEKVWDLRTLYGAGFVNDCDL